MLTSVSIGNLESLEVTTCMAASQVNKAPKDRIRGLGIESSLVGRPRVELEKARQARVVKDGSGKRRNGLLVFD